MEKELKMQSVVVLAQSFNPTIFNRHWLVINNFVDESEIEPTSIFVQNVAQVVTKKFNLLVLPEQLQFNAGNESTNFIEEINTTLLPIIAKLREIPYKAVGLNLNWFIKDDKKSIQTLTSEMFFNEQSKLFKDFASKDTKYGAYLSKNFKNTRLKLDIKPVNFNTRDSIDSQPIEYILCNFNFHLDLSNQDTAANEIIETIKSWETFKKESEKIIELL